MKVAILCIDRDDDLGRKASIDGPVIGKKNILNAAVNLALADPSESDANAMFAAVKLHKEIKDESEVVVLTGSAKVGYESDILIKKQLEKFLKEFKADGAIIVSDGKEDEMLLPVIESIVPVVSVHRVTIHSGEELKGLFYVVSNFLSRAKEDPRLSMLLFGIPGFIALAYALLGGQGWRLIAGIFSAWLIVKGLRMENVLSSLFRYFKASFINLSTSFFLYLLSFVVGIIATVKVSYIEGTPLEIAAKIAVDPALLYFYSILSLLIGLAIDSLPDKKKAYGFASSGVGLGVIVLVMRSVGSWVLDPTYPLSYVITTTLLGLVVVTMTKLSAKFIR
ncbi:MAG: DUF373 family protein [Candidatus Altiarchaeota archaeon]|nr:DUF373 family protein [Candidatus Altiarchaeota archaeon]